MVGASGKVGFSKAMSNGWIALDKAHPEGPRVLRKVEKIDDEVKTMLNAIGQGDDASDYGDFNANKGIGTEVVYFDRSLTHCRT